ncbi:hypothetical protein GCM10011504_53480 [Siccirubricoccus deserti]|nr:hypothetical protein GCM10011504_53480 [Siccirubricoccus deserti]
MQPTPTRKSTTVNAAEVRIAETAPAAATDATADPLLTAREAASEVGLSLPAFWRGVSADRFPSPYYPASRAPRWRRSERSRPGWWCRRRPLG